jgi:hypothetical protein
VRLFERIEDDICGSRIKIPHPLRLPFRQMQTRHLSELGLDKANPVTEVFNGGFFHWNLPPRNIASVMPQSTSSNPR